MEDHDQLVANNINSIAQDTDFHTLTQAWSIRAIEHQYAYNFSWLGRPIIQSPQDIYAFQELIWRVKPDLVIETGIAHGGSLILSASMLAMLDYCDAVQTGTALVPSQSKRRVLGIDIDIREHNRKAIDAHPMRHLIEMFQGSSVASEIVEQVRQYARNFSRVMVFLDSNHTHEHVLAEMNAYAPLVSIGSYCVVWDTGVEDLPENFITNRPWGKGNNPKTAVFEFLRQQERHENLSMDGQALHFEIDKVIEHKLTITAAPDGFLKRIA